MCPLSALKVKAPAAPPGISHARRCLSIHHALHDLAVATADTVYGGTAEGAALSGAGRLRIRVPSNLEPVPVEPDRCGGKQRDGQGIRQHALHLRGPFHVVTCFERRYPLGQQSPRDYSFSPSGEPIKNRERGARRHPAVFRNWSGSDGARRDLRLPGIAPAVFLRTGATGSAGNTAAY